MVDNTKINLRETGWGSMDWIYLAQNRNQWRALVMKLADPRIAGKFLSSCRIGGSSRSAQLHE
jgi:hypothetical protein